MRKFATASLILAGLVVASTAFAVDLNQKGATPSTISHGYSLNAAFVCDNNSPGSAWYQDDTGRYGNVFTFPSGAKLSALWFAHYGFGFPGPYNYDIEVWDLASCTMVAAVNNLVAQDAAGDIMVELVDLCPQGITVSGDKIIAIDANSCSAPDDCYPDVLFDTQLRVRCPYIVDTGAGQCLDVSSQAGPFLLRVEYNTCPVGTQLSTWGNVKQIYR